ncbi:Alpha-N-acetylgalactosaminide alpha-2,6-sialyltransferase 6 [Holothuria leucospilota]|uniref:Alpha-N-acetylgalactosaminide alpha-2,6-sialyltransferase 6 n=1 Tax=Holothuria leucospilota TaxID=206669 RepID=A0A9Q1C9B6_HOLLE|nr:Alpha-N-acetylgalactosaminide alpha-2,6-sialyltransferase 6 [Holothuria leucospilota]
MSDKEEGIQTVPEEEVSFQMEKNPSVQDRLNELKRTKKAEKTKLTRLRLDLVRQLTKQGMLESVNQTVESTTFIYENLSGILDELSIIDAANTAKYEKEMEDIERACDEITTNASKYILSHEGSLAGTEANIISPDKEETEPATADNARNPPESGEENVAPDANDNEQKPPESGEENVSPAAKDNRQSPPEGGEINVSRKGERDSKSDRRQVDFDMLHQLKRVSIATFSGNKKEYRVFRDAFDECVGKSSLSPAYKMLQLRQHLDGEARKVIEGLPASELGFQTALDKLERKYGGERRYLLMNLESLRCLKPIAMNDLKGLENLSDKLEIAIVSLRENKRIEEFQSDSMFYCVAKSKLPSPYIAHYKRWLGQEDREENLDSLVVWLGEEIRIRTEAQEEGLGPSYNGPTNTNGKPKHRTFTASRNSNVECTYCKGNHKIHSCPTFLDEPVDKRWEIAKSKRLCYRCLGSFHKGSECRSSRVCPITNCNKTHHRLLHNDRSNTSSTGGEHTPGPIPSVSLNENATPFVPSMASASGSNAATHNSTACNISYVAMRTVPVILSGYNGKEVLVNALLDECSTDTYLSDSVAKELGLDGPRVFRDVNVLGGNTAQVVGKRVQVNVTRPDNRQFVGNITSFTVDRVTGPIEVFDWGELKSNFAHLQNIPFPKVGRHKTIDLLIGINGDALNFHSCIREVHGAPGEPIARLTPLGWTCIGRVHATDMCYVMSHTHTISPANCSFFCGGLTVAEVLKRTWEIDSQGIIDSKFSPLETKVDKKTEQTIVYDSDNSRYQVAIPWKEGAPRPPVNREMAASRLINLEKNLMKRPKVASEYQRIIKDYESKGYVSKVDSSGSNEGGWYLPHFPVVRDDKETTKVRIVMDAAAKLNDRSLNDCIESGPKLQNDLFEVLLRIRRHPIAMCADISEMFLQIEMDPDSRKYHRFLWRDMDINKAMSTYEFNRLVFGNTASPYLSQKIIRTHAIKNMQKYPKGAESVLHAMYVDDLCDSVSEVSQAVELRHEIAELLGEAGFSIRKWVSNDISVLANIPREEIATSVNIDDNELPSVKTLGMVWDAEIDSYLYSVNLPKVVDLTKRAVFSASATLFDPLNLVVPFTIRARMLMQETWAQGLQWDEPLPESLRKQWENWLNETSELKHLRIERCLVLQDHKSPILDQRLHTFVDASKNAYATAVYLRTAYENGTIAVRLVISKARVAPLKSMSIPRLELCGAVLGVKLSLSVAKILEFSAHEITYWSDSMNVLFWINGASRKYKPFVASRIGFIHEHSEPEQWRYVPTKTNSADLPTRGMTVAELSRSDLWWHAPTFLHKPCGEWPSRPTLSVLDAVNEEIKSSENLTMTVTSKQCDLGVLHPERYSSWLKLVRVTAWLRRFIANARVNSASERQLGTELTIREIESAKLVWYKRAQRDVYSSEIEDLKSGRCLKQKSSLLPLNPCIDEDGILRVNGRLKNAEHLSYSTRCPIILPKSHDITRLIIHHIDATSNHVKGYNHVLSDIRAQYWIVRGREAIKSFQRQCPGCRRFRGKAASQIMAPLPVERLGVPLRAFARAGVDYAGPFLTRQGRGRAKLKRYLCLFTCMATRAVHLEMAYGLDTDSFLNALSRFCDRRNRPIQICSDNGSNFVSADRELRDLVSSLDQDQIELSMSNKGIKWTFNPPQSPHFGGVFESMIKSAKRAIKAVIGNSDVTEEELHTAFTGAEALLNSRPITKLSDDPRDDSVLTPNHFLTGQLGGQLAPTTIHGDTNPSQRWRHVQMLITHFWKRWQREYLPSLQARGKWRKPHSNFQPGDVVIVISPESPRGATVRALIHSMPKKQLWMSTGWTTMIFALEVCDDIHVYGMTYEEYCKEASKLKICWVSILGHAASATNFNVVICTDYPVGYPREHPSDRTYYHYFDKLRRACDYFKISENRITTGHKFLTEKLAFANWASLYNITFHYPSWKNHTSSRVSWESPFHKTFLKFQNNTKKADNG